MKMIKHLSVAVLALSMFAHNSVAEESVVLTEDPHYNEMGFFDIHLCNWPERPNYFKMLFSSEKYEQIETMSVYTPDNQLLVTLDKTKFRTLNRKNKHDKRVYLLDIDVPDLATSGWYRIDVKNMDGNIYHARDYVIMTRLGIVSEMQPSGDDKKFNLPIRLKWKPVPGAKFYQVFVRDRWTEKMVYESKILDTPEIKIPDGKLEQGGDYSWTVHARDTNEHILLGDFHMGSMSEKALFTVAE